MLKPDKYNASNGLTLGHEVLQKCSNFFLVDFGHGSDSKIELVEGLIARFPGEPIKRGTTCLLLQYGFELRAGYIWW